MNGEHMVAGLEENKRQDFTLISIQGQELTTTEFECKTWCPGILEVVWGWQEWYCNPEWTGKPISVSLWALQGITLAQGSRSADHIGYQGVIENAHAYENTSQGKLSIRMRGVASIAKMIERQGEQQLYDRALRWQLCQMRVIGDSTLVRVYLS